MFGGVCVYCDGVVFALTLNDDVYFKSDAGSAARFEEAGGERFTYPKRGGGTASMWYHSVPGEVLESREVLTEWALASVAIER